MEGKNIKDNNTNISSLLSDHISNNKKVKFSKQLLSVLRRCHWILHINNGSINESEQQNIIDIILIIVKSSSSIDGDVERKIYRTSSHLLSEIFKTCQDRSILNVMYRHIKDLLNLLNHQNNLNLFHWRNLSMFIHINNDITDNLYQFSSLEFQRLDYPKKQTKSFLGSSSKSERDFTIQLELYYSIAFTLRRCGKALPNSCHSNIINALRANSPISLSRHAIYLLLFTVKEKPFDEIKSLIDWILLFLRSDKTSSYRKDMLFMTGLFRTITAINNNSTVNEKVITEILIETCDLINTTNHKIFGDFVNCYCNCNRANLDNKIFDEIVRSLVNRLQNNRTDEMALPGLLRICCDVGRLVNGAVDAKDKLTSMIPLVNQLFQLFIDIMQLNSIPHIQDSLVKAIIWTIPDENITQTRELKSLFFVIKRISDINMLYHNNMVDNILDCLISRIVGNNSIVLLPKLLILLDLSLLLYRSFPGIKMSYRLRKVWLILTCAVGSTQSDKSLILANAHTIFEKLNDLLELDVSISLSSRNSLTLNRFLSIDISQNKQELNELSQMLIDLKVSAINILVENIWIWLECDKKEYLLRIVHLLKSLLESSIDSLKYQSLTELIRILHILRDKIEYSNFSELIFQTLLQHSLSNNELSCSYLPYLKICLESYKTNSEFIYGITRDYSNVKISVCSSLPEISSKATVEMNSSLELNSSKKENTLFNMNNISNSSNVSLLDQLMSTMPSNTSMPSNTTNTSHNSSNTIQSKLSSIDGFHDMSLISTFKTNNSSLDSTPNKPNNITLIDDFLQTKPTGVMNTTETFQQSNDLSVSPFDLIDDISNRIRKNSDTVNINKIVLPAPRSANSKHNVPVIPKPRNNKKNLNSDSIDLLDLS